MLKFKTSTSNNPFGIKITFVKNRSIKIIFQNIRNVLIRNFASESKTIHFVIRQSNCKSSHINTH